MGISLNLTVDLKENLLWVWKKNIDMSGGGMDSVGM